MPMTNERFEELKKAITSIGQNEAFGPQEKIARIAKLNPTISEVVELDGLLKSEIENAQSDLSELSEISKALNDELSNAFLIKDHTKAALEVARIKSMIEVIQHRLQQAEKCLDKDYQTWYLESAVESIAAKRAIQEKEARLLELTQELADAAQEIDYLCRSAQVSYKGKKAKEYVAKQIMDSQYDSQKHQVDLTPYY